MWIKITPNDTLFFRSGRPFSMGSETWAEHIFPPYPSTIYGALRTFLIFERGDLKDFKQGKYKDIGTPDEKGTMKITGPFIFNFKHNIIYFPAPLDLVMEKGYKGNNKLLLLSKIKKPDIFYTEYKIEETLIYQGKGEVESTEAYLDNITLKEYLQRGKKEYNFIQKNEFYETELKIGIAREDITLSSKENCICRVPMIRLKKNYSFLAKIDGIESMPENGLFTFGGEGKTINFEKINENPLKDLENMNFELKDGIFKIYLATPAIFKKGWLPGWINAETLDGEKDGIKLKLIACAIGKFIRIGGWDMAKNEPKSMYKAVPAGSVYYFKVLNGVSLENIKKVFHFKNISDINSVEGFGLSFIGVVP